MENLLALVLVPEEELPLVLSIVGLRTSLKSSRKDTGQHGGGAAQENLTFSEGLVLEERETRTPPLEFCSLKLVLAMYAALVWVVRRNKYIASLCEPSLDF